LKFTKVIVMKISIPKWRSAWNVTTLRKFGPAFLVALLLPGGSLIALTLWLTQRVHKET